MARARSERNGSLEDALRQLVQSQATLAQTQATFIQNQAGFVQNQIGILAEVRELQRESRELQRENRERFARIEAILLEHNRILDEYGTRLEKLTDAIREKIGFKLPD